MLDTSQINGKKTRRGRGKLRSFSGLFKARKESKKDASFIQKDVEDALLNSPRRETKQLPASFRLFVLALNKPSFLQILT